MTCHKLVHERPAPTVDVLELADSSVNLAVRSWGSTVDYWSVRYDLLEKIKTRFDEAGISIPDPQLEIAIRDQNGQGNL